MIHRNDFVADTFSFKEHADCEIGTIGKTIKAYKVEQNQKSVQDSSEDYNDSDYEDGQDRSQHSSNSNVSGDQENSNSIESFREGGAGGYARHYEDSDD